MLTLTDFHSDREVKETSGWGLAMLSAFAVALNVLKATVVYVKSVIQKFKKSGER
jgi:hypothetical protein